MNKLIKSKVKEIMELKDHANHKSFEMYLEWALSTTYYAGEISGIKKAKALVEKYE